MEKGLMKGVVRTGVIFAAVFVSTLFVLYVLPAFAVASVLTTVAPTPANNSNISTVGTDAYFYVNFTSNQSLISNASLEVYNITGGGGVMNFTMLNSTGNILANYSYFNVTGLTNGTYQYRIVNINSSGAEENQSIYNFTVTLGQIYLVNISSPGNGSTTNDITPQLTVLANSTFLTNLSLTFYVTKAGVTQAIVNTTILNGTATGFNLTQLSSGTYTVTAEVGNSADFKVNATPNSVNPLTLVVKRLDANATSSVTTVNTGAKQNYTFTIANNGTDSINRINISYAETAYPNPVDGDIVCPTTSAVWNRTVSEDKSIICLLPGPNDDPLLVNTSTTIKVENWSASSTAGLKFFNVTVRGVTGGGEFTIISSKPTATVYGNLSITGTSRVAATTQIGSTNVTVISFNFSATGEQMNISQIIVTRNGTITDAEVISVALYNSTQENVQTFNESRVDGGGGNIDALSINTSAPTNGRYTFSAIGLNITSSQIILVVFNISPSASGGNTFNASIEGASDVTTTGGASGQAITETFTTQRSSSSTIYGNFTIKGTNRVNATTQIGTNRVTLISYNLTAIGEGMNVSEIVFAVNGTSISTADIKAIEIYNSTDPSTTIVNGSQTLRMTNVTASGTSHLVYNFSGLNLTVPAGPTGQVLLVVANISSSATAGHSFNVTIFTNSNVVTTSAVSGQNIVENLTTQASSNSIITGTLSVTGTSRIATTTQIGTKNITVISFNFSATGENMNISAINVTFNGTFNAADITTVGLYNSSASAAGLLDGSGVNYDLIQWNISEPTNGRFNFTNIGFNVTAGSTNVLLVIVNLSDTAATGGHIFNVSIEGAADVVTTGGGSGQSITETFTTQRSSTTLIYGNLSVTGANIAPSGADVGQIGVALLRLTFNASGENVNVSSFNITSNSTSNRDIKAVRLFDDVGGGTTGTYERDVDLPIAGASGVFGGAAGGSVLLTPTTPINISRNKLHYVYVVVDVNANATVGTSQVLGVSVQAAGAISAIGNDTGITFVPQLITGDPGGQPSIRNLSGVSAVVTSGLAVAKTYRGARNNYTFTINNTGTGITDSIDQISIFYGGTGFVIAGNATCPTISSISWNRTILTANTIVCNVTDSGGRLTVNGTSTIVVENFTSGGVTGAHPFNLSLRGVQGGIFNITGSSAPAITVYGELNVTGLNRVNATTYVGANRVTLISYNFTATGEAVNVSEFVLRVNGSSISSADIQSITLFNSTDPSTSIVNGSQTLIMTNVTASGTSHLTYNFSRMNLSIPSGTTGQIILVVVNASSSGTGAHSINVTTFNTVDIVANGGLTAAGIAANLTDMNSSTTTLLGNLTVTGTSRVGNTTGIGIGNVTVISFNFTATGEDMNITGLNITFNGTFTTADIARVGLYNSSAAAAGLLDGSGVNYDLIQWNISAPVNGRYNFSNIGFNVSAGSTNVLLVVINASNGATGGNTFNASIEGTADVIATGGISGQSITSSFVSQRSGSSSFSGTLAVTGTSRVVAWTRLGSSNVTIISYNFSATGEQMNISEIIITRNGTVTNADIVEVKLYNSTRDDAGASYNDTLAYDIIAVNTSAPSNGRYNFSGLSFKVPSSQIVIVVFNMSSGATAGRTFNASIEGIGDIATIGGATGATINETFVTPRSSSSTLVSLNVSATSISTSTVSAGQTSFGVLNITFTAAGETVNVTSLNVTLTGNGTESNITEVRVYRDDAAPLGAFTDADTYLTSVRGVFNGATIQLNMTPKFYNVSLPTSAVTFFVTYNISADALRGSTVGAQLVPSGIAAIGNASGLALTVTGNTVASTNATIQLQSNVVVNTVSSTYRWITNKTTTVNSTVISVNVTNNGQATANLTSVIIIMRNSTDPADYKNASSNFTIVRADSVTSLAGGVTTMLNFTVNATSDSQLVGSVNVSVRIAYNDSNSYAASNNSIYETNTSAFFGLDGFVPTATLHVPTSGSTPSGTFDINFTLNDTGSGINSTTLKFMINSAPRNATCNPSGLNFTCNFSFSAGDSAYSIGSNSVYINVSDNATNAATRAEINFTIITASGGTNNWTYPTSGTFPLGGNVLNLPSPSASEYWGGKDNGDFNFTLVMSSLGNGWSHMYYNINGTSSGWVLATRTNFAGSTLKYLNNTNDKSYQINITTLNLTFKL